MIATAEMKLLHSTNRLGGEITTSESASGITGNIFDTFSGAETSAGGTFYACLYLKNTNASQLATTLSVYINSETAHAGVNVSLALGIGGVNTNEAAIPNETTAPAGITFSDTDTTSSGDAVADVALAFPNLNFGEYHGFWVRMTIDPATAAKTGYVANIKVDYDSPE